MKSIISRYGEMKTGATVDENGEIIDYNKVDTALKSIGISLKDAQYQFRDFDDVIFELSEKWDSLDKNTQRYIATIMAGNRQQSRFIALVDNWERLDEVATAAQNSEDAGLLQYSKTLDSLETKLNNIKTSFQEFYMSIINGPVISKALEAINNLFEGFNKQGPFAALLDVGSIVSSLTIIGNMFVSIFSAAFGQISANWKAMLRGLPTDAAIAGQEAGTQYRNGATQPKGIGKLGTGVTTAASFAGLALTTLGAAKTEKQHNNVGAGISAVGNALSYGSMGFMLSGGNPVVAIVAGALGGITSAISSWRSDLELEQAKLEEAAEKAEKSNITRAEKKNEYETLKREISNLEELKKARFDSAEAQQEWINANNALFEQFPYLAATFDEVGNATIDLESAEQALAIARKASLQATIKAAEDEKNRAQQDLNVAKEKQKEKYDKITTGQKFKLESGKTYKTPALISGAGAYPANFEQWLLSSKRSEQVELLKQTGVLSEKVAKSGQVSYKLSNDSNVFSTFLFYFLDQLNAEQHSEWLATFEGLTQEETLSKLISEGASKFTNSEGNQIYKTTQDFLAAWLHNGEAFTSLNEQQQEYIEYIIATINSSTQEIEGLENQITGADKTLLASKTTEQLQLKEERDEKDYDETYGKIVGWDNYVTRYVKEAQAAVEEPFDDNDIEREVEAAVAQWDDLENTLNNSNLEEYNSLVESFEKGNISIVDYINSLENLFNGIIPDAVENTQKWAENEVNKNIKDLAQGLSNKASWKKKGRENWESETEDISDTEKWLKTIPENLHQNIVDYVNYVNELLTNAKIESSQADSMIEAYTGLYDAINSASVTPEKKAEAFALLDTADLTSLGGIYEYQTALKKVGIELNSDSQVWNNLIQQVLVNIITETQTFQQKLASALDADVKLLKQAYDGVDSVVEATELASKLGVTLADFETSDGKIRLKRDVDLKAKREEELDAYKKDLYGEGEGESWTSGDSVYAKEYRRAQSSEGLNVESEFYKKYQTEFEKWQNLPENSNKSLADYIKARRNSELAAIDSLFTKFWEEQEKLIKKQSIIDSIYGGEAERKKLSAQQSLASGGQGLSGDTIYDILNAYDYNPEEDWRTYFTKNADGTFDIIKDTELFNELDQVTKNAILALIDSERKSAKDAINSLAKNFAQRNASDNDYRQAFANTLMATSLSKFKEEYQNALNAAIGDSEDYRALENLIRAEGTITDEAEIIKAAKQMVATYRDELTQNNLRFVELSLKQLDGTITDTEALELKELNVSGTFKTLQEDMISKGEDFVMTWAAILEAIMGSGLNWSEIENTLKKGYSDQLEGIIGKSEGLTFKGKKPIDSYGLSESLRNIRKAEGVYTKDIITSLLTNLSQATGKAIDLTDEEIEKLFQWDSSKGAFSFTGDAAVFYEKFGIEAEEFLNYLQDAFVDSENRKALNDAIKKEDLQANFAESFAQIYNNLGEATLKDINELYNSVYGENALADNQEDFKAINEAILNNDTTQLAKYLLKIAKEAGFEIDDPNIQAQLADTQRNLAESILTNIQNAIEGSLSETDLLDLGKQLNLNLNQFAFQTASGMQLNEEGILRAATEFTKNFGSGYNIAETLVNSFAGTEHMLGSYERVTDLINEATNNTSHWAAQNTEVLSILRQIQAQYMLMESDKQFDFMNYDPMQGGADNWKTFTDNVSSAMNVLKTAFESGSKIDYTQISSIISWLGSQGVESLGATNISLETFNNTILNTMDAVGQVDLAAAAMELGIGISDMASAFDTGIEKVADQQIAYWSKYKAFLEGIKKLQTVSNDLKIEPPKLADDGTWTFDNQIFNTQIDAYESYINKLYKVFEGIEVFNGENNPIMQMFKSAFNVDTGTINKDQITEQMMQQVNNLMQLFRSESLDWVANAGSFFKADGTFNLPLFLEAQIETSTKFTNNESDGNTKEEIKKPVAELEQTLTSMGAEKTGENTYTFAQDNLQVSLDISTGAINFSFVDGSITPDPEAVNKILKAAGYLSDGTITFKQDNMTIVLSPTSGTVTGDFSNITGEAITESDLLKKLGITNNNDGTITFTTSSFNATIIPSSGVINSDLSNVTGQGISDTELLAKLGIVKNKSGYAFTALDGTSYNFTVGPTGIAVFDSGGISTEGVSTDALLTAILAKALSGSGWKGTGTSYTYNDGPSGTYTYKASGTSSYDISRIHVYSTDLAKKIEKQNLKGWSGNSTSGYIYKGKTATFTYNASGKMNIVPSKTDGETPTMGALLKENFTEDLYQVTGSEAEGWNVAAKDGTTLFTIPAGIKLEPAKESSLGIDEDGVISGLTAEATITANTKAVESELEKFNGHTVEVNLQFSNAENQLVNKYSNFAKDVQNAESPTLSWKYGYTFQPEYKELAQDAALHSTSLTKDDLILLQNIQAEVNKVYENIGKKPEGYDVIQGIIDNASTATDSLSQLADVFNSLSSGNLGTNLISFVEVLTSLISLNTASLDLSQFIDQLNLLGNIQLNEEQLLLMQQAAQALASALAPLNNATITIDNSQALSAIENIQAAINGVTGKTVTVTVKKIEQNIRQPQGLSNYSGNVSGLAYVEGNAYDRLLAGAHLVNKTLVGELGPELAVYDDQYHLLGQNGAEFVNLPSNALVFNHRQTEGILKGQSGHRGKALVNGNVSGPAAAGGIDAAIAAVNNIIKVWSNLKDATISDLVNGGGGGGGGGDPTAHIEELQEWYNLSRKIADVEQEINNIMAERENLTDGRAYLRSLRKQQELLQSQVSYQETLLNYQKQQLKNQADEINNNKLWSQFIHVGADGLLQYNKGNEINGGKGALEVLQDLNEMSGKEQIAFMNKIGYSYTNTDGKKLEGEELVAQFFDDLQSQIDNYDALRDTVHETKQTLEELETSINKINQEIIDNQLELETEIYNLIVKAWEKEIKKMEEYANAVEEANQKYIEGLQDALEAEQELYKKDESIADRESLQRQLALLRRSGGSASEIASLEEELSSMLKDEYFANQQDVIDDIQKTNEAQLEALQQQIQLEEDALAFQQENGLIWNQVNEIMQGGFDSMMNFFTAKDNEFFEASALAQIEKLDDWAKRVGIYDEDQTHQKYEDKAKANLWDNNVIWDNSLSNLKAIFDSMKDSDKKNLQDATLNAYANAKLEGKTDEEATNAAKSLLQEQLQSHKDSTTKKEPTKEETSKIDTPKPKKEVWAFTYKGTYYEFYDKLSAENKINKLHSAAISQLKPPTKTAAELKPGEETEYNNAWKAYNAQVKQVNDLKDKAKSSLKRKYYSQGGLVDYTGTAVVHGSPSKPEAFLNAEQTKQIRNALIASNDSTLLNLLRKIASQLNVVSNKVSNSISNNRSIEIAQGAVQVQVGTLANSYDVEDLSNDIMGRIVAIADKSTNRSVGRR